MQAIHEAGRSAISIAEVSIPIETVTITATALPLSSSGNSFRIVVIGKTKTKHSKLATSGVTKGFNGTGHNKQSMIPIANTMIPNITPDRMRMLISGGSFLTRKESSEIGNFT
jgi:hypothetical protein